MSIDKSKRNSLAGKHPSYKKRNLSKASIAKKRAYDKKFSSSPQQKKKRAELNKKNRKDHASGKTRVGDKLDQSHDRKGRMRPVSQRVNRGRTSKNGGTAGDRRARG